MKSLGEILEYEQPTKYIVKSENYDNSYSTPVLTPGQTFILGYTNEKDGIYSDPLPVIIFDDFTTATKLVNFPFKVKSSAMKILKPANKNVYILYWYYYLSSLKVDNDLHKRYWISTFANRQVPVPALSEQKRIAERLDKVQELIALQKEQLKKLDDLIKSRFIDLFGDPITNSKKFKIDTLNNICDVRDGTHASPEYVLKGYPLITSKNIINGEISLEEVNFITKLDFDNINKRSKVDVGDILLPMIGTIGNPALVEQEPNYAIKNMALIKFWPQSRCSNLYILYLLRSSFLDNIIKNQQRGGTQKFLALKTIRGLQIPIPPISSQVQFADFVTKIEAQKGLLATRLSHLETLYKSLMQEYFG